MNGGITQNKDNMDKFRFFLNANAQIQFQSEYQNVLDYAIGQGIQTPSLRQNKINNKIVKTLKETGNWNELELFYYFKQDSNLIDFSKINWVNPNSFYLTQEGTLSFVSGEGFKTNSSQYLDSGYIPSVHAEKSLIDDISMFWNYWDNDGFASGTRNSSSNWNLSISNVIHLFKTSSSPANSNTFYDGVKIAIENGVNQLFYLGNNLVSSVASESAPYSTHSLTLLALNNGGNKSISNATNTILGYWGCGSSNINTNGLAQALEN
jgi:hypothetical protein